MFLITTHTEKNEVNVNVKITSVSLHNVLPLRYDISSQ
jgi:hypothetical protein